MNYQLVLQFREAALQKFLRLGDLEASLQVTLRPLEMLDGLDQGEHGTNLFIYTNHPAETLARVRPLLGQSDESVGFRAAYRQVASETFHVLSPTDSAPAFTLR